MTSGFPPLRSRSALPFWEGLRDGRILIPQCAACGHWSFYPRQYCIMCESSVLDWREVAGCGRVYSFSIAEVPVSPPFSTFERMVIAVVEIAHGIKMPTNIVQVDPDNVKIGMDVEAFFDGERYPGISILLFRPATEESCG